MILTIVVAQTRVNSCEKSFLFHFYGPDQPNQFTRLMQVLSTHSLQILDVGQAVIHNQLTLGIVISSDDQTATAFGNEGEILILAHDIGLNLYVLNQSLQLNTTSG